MMRLVLLVLAIASSFFACSREAGRAEPLSPAAIERGRTHYREHGCGVCHGVAGRGDGPSAASQKPPPRDFQRTRDFRVVRTVESLADFIAHGKPSGSGAMPRYAHLDDATRRDLARFVLSLGAEPGREPGR
jgi:mono/diheme cytochrome c family protein